MFVFQQTPRDRLRPVADQDAPPRPAKRPRRREPRGPLIDSNTQLQARRNLQFDAETVRDMLNLKKLCLKIIKIKYWLTTTISIFQTEKT